MRKILTFAAALALAGCGGGGGGSASTPQSPTAPATTAPVPSGKYVTPTFFLRIPPRQTSAKGRSPRYVSSATLSVVITLTADSTGVDPATIGGNPAMTQVSSGQCSSGCVVNGPPTPPGSDSFRVVTYDNATPANGNAINAGQANNQTITVGQDNPITITLGGIPKTLALSNVPTNFFNAGTTHQTDFVSVIAYDADGSMIPTSQSPAVKYADATGAPLSITISDPDTNAYGTCVETPPANTTCSGGAATSAGMPGPDIGVTVRYDGLAENPVVITASAPGATNDTATITPNLNAPQFNSSQATPSGVALTTSAEIDLFATSGLGSTGSESFTESGWTNAPYNHALTVDAGTCPAFETIGAGTNSTTNGTPITATVTGTPTANSCTATVSDGLTSNTTGTTTGLTVTYTTMSTTVDGKGRRTH
jgi:hypothetical protein